MKRDIENRKRKSNDDYDIYSFSGGSHKKPKRYSKGFVAVINVLLSILLVTCITASAGSAYLMYGRGWKDSNVSRKEEFKDVVGSNENTPVQYFLIAGMDEGRSLTDIMMIVCFDMEHKTANILQIPRDTFIGQDIPTGKMNAVYGHPEDGQTKINAMLRRINNFFGLPIDHYITVDLNAFRVIVDAVGGVDVYVPSTIYNAFNEGRNYYTFYEGMNHMDGQMAEAFVRHRKSYGMGDLGRVQAQRNFYSAFIKKCLTMTNSQMIDAATGIYKDITTDMTLAELIDFATIAQGLKTKDIQFHAVPGQSCTFNGISYYSVHKEDFVTMLNQYFLPYTVPIVEDNLLVVELHSYLGHPKYNSWIEDKDNIDAYLSEQEEQE